MDGFEFYQFLRQTYSRNGQPLYGNFTFKEWLYKTNGTYSFRFNVRNQAPKAIPKNILVGAWDANRKIDDNWLAQNYDLVFSNDCRLHVLSYLLDHYDSLRRTGGI